MKTTVRISQKTEECNPEKLRKTESFGIEHIDEKTERKQVFQVLDSYQKTCISNHNNRHFDAVSRKDDHTPSPVNKEISKLRKENVIKRLKKEPQLLYPLELTTKEYIGP